MGAGAGHTQELSIYVIQPDGKGFRRVTPAEISAGSPKWSADGTKIVCYEIDHQGNLRRAYGRLRRSTSQIVTIDVATGAVKQETSGPGLKVSPQFLPDGTIGYTAKGSTSPTTARRGPPNPNLPPIPTAGIAYTTGAKTIPGTIRNAAWSPDGKQVVYQVIDFTARPQNKMLYSWDLNYDYRYTDVFPTLSVDGKLAVTDLNSVMGNPATSITVMNSDGSDRKRVFYDPSGAAMGETWSPDGKKLIFGFGGFFPARDVKPARLIVVNADGSEPTDITGKTPVSRIPVSRAGLLTERKSSIVSGPKTLAAWKS